MAEEPNKVDLATPALATETRAKLEELFPGIIADGVLDATRLGELLDIDVTAPADGRERFGLMWAGKQEAVRSLLTSSRGALFPDLNKSINFDRAEDVFIEGDNLEVLKLLQKAYNDRIKLVFIDPPYNTGNDFVYHDDFADGLRGYLGFTGQLDAEGRRKSTSSDARLGRRHSRWLSMMYPRLVLARNLLRQDGSIFVTIDDNESAHLRLLMDEVFGPENFLANIVWKHTQQSKNDEPYFSRHWNSILAYRRSGELSGFVLPRTAEHNKAYRNPDDDPKGEWRSGDVRSPSPRPTLRFPIVTPSGKTIQPPENGWRWSKASIEQKISSGEIFFSPDESKIVRKIYLADQGGRTPENVWDGAEVGVTRDANREIQDIFGSTVFDTPKPTALIRRILEMATSADSDDVVLDFFAGSGSTAHAVALQNAKDGGRRRVISVNVPEPTAEESVAYGAGFHTVSAITLARIEWVVENVDGAADGGLRVFRLSPSNFHDSGPPTSDGLFNLESTTLAASDSDPNSVAAEILLKEGMSLDSPWERVNLNGGPVIRSNGIAVVLILDITDAVVEEAFALAPRVLVFLEDGFAGKDAVKANALTQARNLGVTMKTI